MIHDQQKKNRNRKKVVHFTFFDALEECSKQPIGGYETTQQLSSDERGKLRHVQLNISLHHMLPCLKS